LTKKVSIGLESPNFFKEINKYNENENNNKFNNKIIEFTQRKYFDDNDENMWNGDRKISVFNTNGESDIIFYEKLEDDNKENYIPENLIQENILSKLR